MTYLLVHIGGVVEVCSDCLMDLQMQKCKAGYLRQTASVIRRGQIRYIRSKQCRKDVMLMDCRTCFFRKLLSANNWCKWFRAREGAEFECINRGRRYWRPFSIGSVKKDQLEEFERLEDLE